MSRFLSFVGCGWWPALGAVDQDFKRKLRTLCPRRTPQTAFILVATGFGFEEDVSILVAAVSRLLAPLGCARGAGAGLPEAPPPSSLPLERRERERAGPPPGVVSSRRSSLRGSVLQSSCKEQGDRNEI